MKNIILLLLATSVTINTFSQTTFEKLYKTLNGSGSLVKADTSGFYLGGYALMNGGIKSALIKTDWQGEVIREQAFPNEYGSIRIVNNNEFVFLHNPSNLITKSDVRVTKMNPAGDTNWSKTYVKQNWDEPEKIIPTSDKGYLVVGHSNSLPGILAPHPYDAYILKLNQSGDTLWSKMIGEPAINEYAWDAIETADMNYFVTGNDANGRVLLFKLDASGTLLWTKKYKNNYHNQPNCIALTNDNYCLVVGTCTTENSNQSHFYALKIDTDGNLIREKNYSVGEYNYRPVLQLLDSGFLIAGNNQEDRIVLLKASNEGEVMWSKTLQTRTQGSVSSIDVCPDGGFLLANRYCFSLLKTDSVGCVQPILLSVTGERNVSLHEAIPFSVSDVRGDVYYWSSNRGTVTNGQGTKQISMTWSETGTDTLKAYVENECGRDSILLIINIFDCVPLKISPIQQAGYFDFFVEKTEGKSPVYSWQVDQGTIVSGQHTNHIVVDWTTTGELKVRVKVSNDCSQVADSLLFFYSQLNETNQTAVHFFPNPTYDGNFQISTTQSTAAQIQIYNCLGQLIDSAELSGITTRVFDISSHGQGLYYIKIRSGKNLLTKKLLYQYK